MEWVFDQFDLPSSSRIPELGCGTAALWAKNAHRVSSRWEIVLTDLSPGMVREALQVRRSDGERFTALVCDAQSVPFDDESFDAVIANHTLYHIQADIPHIRLRVFKEPAILHDGDDSGIHERRQLSHRAHKTISRCRELACARQRRQLSARLHTLQLIQAHSSPLAILVTSDDPKDDSLVKNPF